MKVGILVGAMIVAVTGAGAAQGPAPRMPLESAVQLWFDGGSTVRAFKCSAKSVTTNVQTEAMDAAAASLAELVTKASVVIPVASVDCGNGTMNEHMRKALKASAHPEIKFVMSGYTVSGANAMISGKLQIAGVENAIEIPATITAEGAGVRVKASKAIDMTQWGVKPPSLMMGTMKVKPGVTVGFDVSVKR